MKIQFKRLKYWPIFQVCDNYFLFFTKKKNLKTIFCFKKKTQINTEIIWAKPRILAQSLGKGVLLLFDLN